MAGDGLLGLAPDPSGLFGLGKVAPDPMEEMLNIGVLPGDPVGYRRYPDLLDPGQQPYVSPEEQQFRRPDEIGKYLRAKRALRQPSGST